MRALWASCALLVATSAHADVDLQNDSFTSGQQVAFQGGFVAGEIAASRFVAPMPGAQLLKVTLLFGPDSSTPRQVTLRVYDDSAGTDIPGAEIHSGDFNLTGSSTATSEIALAADNITVPQQFRVGIEFSAAGAPSIAADTDGAMANRNFIKLDTGDWVKSTMFPVSGDWVIRATVSGTGGGDAGVNGGPCNSNVDCATGSFCDTAAHTCTFDCRTNADCGEGTCNSLGMCVGGGGGCCQTDRGSGHWGGWLLGLGFLVLLRRRK